MNKKHYLLWAACCLFLSFVNRSFAQTVSGNLVVTPQSASPLNVCSGQGTFVVRVSNITASAITGVTLRDSLPPGIRYIPGSVSGTGVTFGSTVASNVVTFNIASIPASGFVDVSFSAAASCAVSTSAASIVNTYRASWSTFTTTPVSTSSYALNFPSLSVNVTNNATFTGTCGTVFVRTIVVTNGGSGPIDTLTLTDVNGSGITLKNMIPGVFTSSSASSGKLVLAAPYFDTVGNLDGRLDQNESITIYDTVILSGASSFSGVITANWGCQGSSCANGTTNNIFNVNATLTTIAPVLSRQLFVDSPPDSVGFFNRTVLLREVIKNTGTVVANAVKIYPGVSGTRYLDTAGLRMRYNLGALTKPTYTTYRDQAFGTAGVVMEPNPMPHANEPIAATVELGSILPGDSVTVYLTVRRDVATRVNGLGSAVAGGFIVYSGGWLTRDGLPMGPTVDVGLYWEGCTSGVTYNDGISAPKFFPELYYNGLSATPVAYTALTSRPSSAFTGFSMIDSSDLNGRRCSYYDGDTAKLTLSASLMSLPFYSDKSKFFIRLKVDPGLNWDGNTSTVKGYINTSSSAWIPSAIVNNISADSTIDIYFFRASCPNSNFGATNSYQNAFRLSINMVNTCAGSLSNTKKIRMFRYYDVDTTVSYPILAGADSIFAGTLNSTCGAACTDGIGILNYSNLRTTYDRPDNDNDGIADATGSIDMSKVAIKTITWGDTMAIKMRMVVHTTQPGGVPYLYVSSAMSSTVNPTYGTTLNGYLLKAPSSITVHTTGGSVYTGTGSAPGTTGNTILSNLSLTGTGGISIAGYTAYQDGDTVDLLQNVVYYSKSSLSDDPIPVTIKNTPYSSIVTNPTPAERFICDTNICTFNMYGMSQYRIFGGGNTATLCSDSTVLDFFVGADGGLSGATSTNCGDVSPFVYEIRNLAYATTLKIRVPSSAGVSLTSVALNWYFTQQGNCVTTNVLPLGTLSTSEYTISGDTVILNFRTILQGRGYDLENYDRTNMGQLFRILLSIKKPGMTACQLDHVPQFGTLPTTVTIATKRPTEDWVPVTGTQYAQNINARFGGAQVLNNFTTTVLNPVVTATSQSLPINITIATASSSAAYDYHWIGVRTKPGQIVDSVVDLGTGSRLTTLAGSNVYQIGALTVNQTKNYRVYLRITSCNSDSVWIFADRTPCGGYPGTVASGSSCLQYADSVKFRYVTFAGELQLTSNLTSNLKDICVADTLLMQVSNSQTPTAQTVRLNMNVPDGISFVPGTALMKTGSGPWTVATDPVAGSGGNYTWDMPATDTLAGSSAPPNNSLQYQVAFMTDCNYISGSQIGTTVEGTVACGPITSLFNTNPAPLNINGATSNYIANITVSADTVSDCNTAGSGYAFRLAIPFTGTAGALTSSTDSVIVRLPEAYTFTFYSSAAAGSHNAPASGPATRTGSDGSTLMAFPVAAGITMGDSVVFTFMYSERSIAVNKCAANPAQAVSASVLSSKSLYCATTSAVCPGVKLSIGADTLMLVSAKPSLSADVLSGALHQYSCGMPCGHPDSLFMSGTITNIGTGNMAGTAYMEVFLDRDSSGSVTAGDIQLKTYAVTGGINKGTSASFSYSDTVSAGCTSCTNKPVLVRFSNNPAGGSAQCLCDSSLVQVTSLVLSVPLPIQFGPASVQLENCNARIAFQTYSEDEGATLHIARSGDGKNWKEISKLQGKGSRSGVYSYTVIDQSPLNGMNYYRISQVNQQGLIVYGKVLPLNNTCPGSDEITVYPNPAQDELYLTSASRDLSAVTVKLLNQLGQEMNYRAVYEQGRMQINTSSLPGGVYVLKVTDNEKLLHAQPIVIRK